VAKTGLFRVGADARPRDLPTIVACRASIRLSHLTALKSGEPLRLQRGAVGVGRAAAVSALNKLDAARVFNDYDFGGYLIWAASRPHTLRREILFRVQRRQRIAGAG
jgi:hypothetical protein